jgi:hypothetical protein
MVAAVLAFLGAAAVSVPDNPGSWGTMGGATAIAGGLAFVAAAAYDWLRSEDKLLEHGVPEASGGALGRRS